jgi:hypothetical protein
MAPGRRNVVKRAFALLLAALLLSGLGCGGERDKGVNKDRDRPQPADKNK